MNKCDQSFWNYQRLLKRIGERKFARKFYQDTPTGKTGNDRPILNRGLGFRTVYAFLLFLT
jgi:hypothetical protein